MVLKFQDNLGHFTSICNNGQDDVIKVCHDYCSEPHACSKKGIAKNGNLSKEVIVPKETYFPLDNIYEELLVQIMLESILLGLHQFFWLFSVFKSVCCNSKLFMLEYATDVLLDYSTSLRPNLSPSTSFQQCVFANPCSLITFQNRNFPLSILK